MNYLLHIDTATDIATVAIGGDGVLLAERSSEGARNHASSINLMIDEVLADAGITMQQLAGIAVCSGPGSYTGLRIGMATAKGLCYVLDKPLILNDRLTLMANSACKKQPGSEQYVPFIKARENEYFIGIFDHLGLPLLAPQHMMAADVAAAVGTTKKTYMITDVPTSELYDLKVNNDTVDNTIRSYLSAWVAYAYLKYKCEESVNLSVAEPLYLKQVYTHK